MLGYMCVNEKQNGKRQAVAEFISGSLEKARSRLGTAPRRVFVNIAGREYAEKLQETGLEINRVLWVLPHYVFICGNDRNE